MSYDPGAGAETEPAGPVAAWVEERDGPVEVLQPCLVVTEGRQVVSENQMPLDLDRPVPLLCSQVEELPTDRRGLVELPPVQVERGQAPQHREQPRQCTRFLQHRERLGVGLFDLLRVTADRQQSSGEAGEDDGLACLKVGRRGSRGDHSKKVARELDGLAVPASSVVERPHRIEEVLDPVEFPRGDPVPPCRSEVPRLGRQLVQHFSLRETIPSADGELREVLCVRPSRFLDLRMLLQSLGGELSDHVEHGEPAGPRLLDASNKALVDKRGESLHHVDITQEVEPIGNTLPPLHPGGWEQGEQGEDDSLVRSEEVVAPFDGAPERLLAVREVSSSSEQVEAPL